MSTTKRPLLFTIVALPCLALAIGVFAIRLGHAGPYAMPQGGAVYGALGLAVIATVLLGVPQLPGLGLVAVLASPIAMFPALYSIMGESEEVISLYATNENGQAADLRLWIVEDGTGAWLGMAGAKARAHNLDGAELQMLRAGTKQCVVPALHDDRPTVKRIHALKVEKYAAARLAGGLGLYPLEAPETTVVLRLDPCA